MPEIFRPYFVRAVHFKVLSQILHNSGTIVAIVLPTSSKYTTNKEALLEQLVHNALN